MSEKVDFLNLNQIYYPGTQIKGLCKVTVNDNMHIKALSLALTGTQFVEFTTQHKNELTNRQEEKRYVQREIICNNDMTIWGDSQRGLLSQTSVLPIGIYEYEFSFSLPDTTMPSSITMKNGYNKYQVELRIHRRMELDSIYTKEIKLCDKYELTKELLMPMTQEQMKSICCLWCTGGVIQMECQLNKSGFNPGEQPQIELTISNYSARDINQLSINLIRQSAYTAALETMTAEDVLCSSIQDLIIPAHSGEFRTLSFQLPSIPSESVPVFKSKLIEIKYFISVKVGISWACDSLFIFRNIQIGGPHTVHSSYYMQQSWPLPVQVHLKAVKDALPRYEDL